MKFTKMHGLGNDYVFVNCFEETPPEDIAAAAVRISDRHFGVGSDGLILIKPGKDGADAEMEMYNADGSKAEMCGNGLRCVAKYLYDRGIVPKDQLRILTGAGVLTADIVDTDEKKASQIRLNMGRPVFNGLDIPTVWDLPKIADHPFAVGGWSFSGTCVSMGNPHCVVYVDDVESFPVETFGPRIETAPFFPNRINVEFVQVISKGEVIQRTFERGSGETLACGTGASAVCAAGVLSGRTGRSLLIHLSGGDLHLEYRKDDFILLSGPAAEVFSGEIDL